MVSPRLKAGHQRTRAAPAANVFGMTNGSGSRIIPHREEA
jgi:hypothetical protein